MYTYINTHNYDLWITCIHNNISAQDGHVTFLRASKFKLATDKKTPATAALLLPIQAHLDGLNTHELID